MKIWILLLLVWSILPSQAEGENRGKRGHRPEPGSAWMGIHLTWMEKATAAQLNGVPEGFGLLIDEVTPLSPAHGAGLQPLDVVWKYDDQLVASKRQLHALIKRTGIGNEAALTVSRAGENVVMPIVIGLRPENPEELIERAPEVMMPPLPGAIVRHLDLGKLSGFIKEGEVTVSLCRKEKGFLYAVSEGEKVLKEGVLPGEDPDMWPKNLGEKTTRKLEVLFESLENAEQREANAPRQPRVRRVPTPPAGEQK